MLHNGLSQTMSSSGSRPCRGRGRGKWLEYQNPPPLPPVIPSSSQIIKDDDVESNHDIITAISLQGGGARGKPRKPEQQLYIPRPRRMQQQPPDNDDYTSPYCLGDNNDERGLTPTSPEDFYPQLFGGNSNNNVNTPQQSGRKNTPRATCTARKTRREVEIYIPRAKRLMQQGGGGGGTEEDGQPINCRPPTSPLDRLSGEFSTDWTAGSCQDVSMEVNRQGVKPGLQCSINNRNSRQTTTHRSPDSGRRGRRSKPWGGYQSQSPSSSDDSGSSERKVTLTPASEDRNRRRPCGRKNRNAIQPNQATSPDNGNKGIAVIQRCPGEINANVLRCTNEKPPNELVVTRGTGHKATHVNELTEVCDKTAVAASNLTRQRRRSPVNCDPNKFPFESKPNVKGQTSSTHLSADQDSKQGIPYISPEAKPSPSSLVVDIQQIPADQQQSADIPKKTETDLSASLSTKSPQAETMASCKRSSPTPSSSCKEADTSSASKDSDNHCPVNNLLNKSKKTLSNTDLDSSTDENNVLISEDVKAATVKAARKSPPSSSAQEQRWSTQNGSPTLPCALEGEDEGTDSWDALYDENGDCLDPTVMEELTANVGKVQIQKTKINYLEFQPKESDLDYKDYDHVVEVYDFSSELQTRDLIAAFSQFKERGFDIKWVDDTHALAIFNSPLAAEDALSNNNPLLKVRRMADASKKSKQKAKRCTEFLQPYKPRPETSAITARRMVTGALGLTPRISKQKRDQERQQLKEAREKKRQDRLIKRDMWEGTVGSSTTTTVDATTQ